MQDLILDYFVKRFYYLIKSAFVLNLLLLRKTGFVFVCYRPPDNSNLSIFFGAISTSLRVMMKSENVVVIGDFNTDVTTKDTNFERLEELYNVCI